MKTETAIQAVERLAKEVESLRRGMKNLILLCMDKDHIILETGDEDLFDLHTSIEALHNKKNDRS